MIRGRLSYTAIPTTLTDVIKLAAVFGHESMILPMHDAILMQFPEASDVQGAVAEVVRVMRDAFHEYCPGVEVRVVSGAFAE